MSATVYNPVAGDEFYTIPGPGGYGFVFARGSNPSGGTLPSAAVLRDDRVYLLRAGSDYDMPSAAFVCETPMTSAFGQEQAAFCLAVWLAWRENFGIGGAAPATLAALAEVIGWVAA